MILFKRKTCLNINNESYNNNTISLYVVLTRKCNVNCKFCEYHSGESSIDLDKFNETYKKLYDICEISDVHFTGGEPTLEIEKLKQICKIVKAQSNLTVTSVNTNGTVLNKLENINELDNISLSRHDINDTENQKIFGSNIVPTAISISEFKDLHKIHLSCNLIKGHIDSTEKVQQYLEFVSTLGINDVGLVSLMNINEYCNNHFIDIENIHLEEIERCKKVGCFQNISEQTGQVCCKCSNYLYRANNKNLMSVYYRHAIKSNEIADYLVYDNNTLKQGFNGKQISL